jgi:O-antigen ligase/polysaccharide polymerase Wzy-like membrane protein
MNTSMARMHRAVLPFPARASRPRDHGDWIALLVSVLVASDIGAAVVFQPALAILPVAALGALLLLVDARARLLFLVFGGLMTLQSSDSFGRLKLLYLMGVVVSFGGALFALSRNRDWSRRALAAPLLRISIVFFTLIAVSLLVARAHEVPRVDWMRDVAPYVLFALAPFFALDAQSALTRRTLLRILVVAGCIATVSFATHWLEQRQIAHLPFSRFALSSIFFPGALFAYAVAASLHADARRVRWISLGGLVFALMIVTGTRSALSLVVEPVVVAFGARRYFSTRSIRLLMVTPVLVVVVGAAAYSVVAATGASTSVISERIAILKVSGNRSQDASFNDRVAQADAAWSVFKANPALGAGPGTVFEWEATNHLQHESFILDTPLTYPAKFGLAGLAAFVFLILGFASFLRSAFRFDHPRTETLALAAYAALAAVGCFLTTPIEDKGFSLGLILLLALVFRTTAAPASAEPRRDTAGA